MDMSNPASDVPPDWQIRPLSGLGAQVTSGSRGWARYYARYGDLFVRITNLTRRRVRLNLAECRYVQINPDEAEAKRTRLEVGDLLVSITADIGIIGYVDETVPAPAYINQHIARVRLDPNLADSRFVAYYLASWAPQRRFVSATDTGAKAGMNLTTVAGLTTVVPEPAEQRRIAEVLAAADDLVATLERTLAKKQALKRGMAQELLTGRTRLPGFTALWSRVSLGAHVSYLKTVPLSRAQLDTASAVRCLHYGDIHTTTDLYLNAAEAPMPRASSALVDDAGRLEVGDLVFADASEDPDGVGRSVEITAIPPEGAIAGLHTIAARFDKVVLADGYKAYLQLNPEFRRTLLRLAAGTKVLATTRAYISNVVLNLPSVEEQRAIARALGDAECEIDALRARLKKANAIKQGMGQQLLTGRVRLPVLEVVA
jgi:type I restriction enzyme S subunit